MALVTNVFRRGAAYHFRARGPETFWRSGERCRQTWRDEVSKRLSADAVIDASKIEVASHDGAVTLNGEVTTSAALAHAEEVAHALAGVSQVENRLLVA